MKDQVLQDQLDFFGRISADEYFAGLVAVLLESKGDIASDLAQALSTLNAAGNSKIGAVVIVHMPTLAQLEPDAPGPESKLRITVEVVVQPLFNDSDQGTGLDATAISERVRQIMHNFSNGRTGVFTFEAQEPVPGADIDKIANYVSFTRRLVDDAPQSCGLPLITPDAGAAPQSVTLTTDTAGAAIYHSLDGSYPSAAAAALSPPTSFLYTAPIAIAAACTLRAAAQKTGLQQSAVAQAIFT